jgi:hypothetical protein
MALHRLTDVTIGVPNVTETVDDVDEDLAELMTDAHNG